MLTRHASAIETLGSATVLCVDKTGTLTQNRMTVKKLFADGQHRMSKVRSASFATAYLNFSNFASASQREGFDPWTLLCSRPAIVTYWERSVARDVESGPGISAFPQLLAVTRVWRSPEQDGQTVAVKGAPGAVAELCCVSPSQLETIKSNAESLAAEGWRILAVARAGFGRGTLPEDPHGFDFKFLGLVALADPCVLRSRNRCRSATRRESEL